MEINDGLELSPPPTKLKNKTGVSSTMNTDVIDSGTSLYIYIYIYIYISYNYNCKAWAGPLIMSEEGLVLTHKHESWAGRIWSMAWFYQAM